MTNWTTLAEGIGFCAGLVGLAVAAYFLLPEVATVEAGAALTTASGLGGSALFAEGMSEVVALWVGLAVGCGGGVAGSFSVS